MPDTPPLDDDDALADALADAWVEAAATDPAMRRLALRAAGLSKAPADMDRPEFARSLGVSDRTLRRVEAVALRKLALNPAARLALQAYTQRTHKPPTLP